MMYLVHPIFYISMMVGVYSTVIAFILSCLLGVALEFCVLWFIMYVVLTICVYAHDDTTTTLAMSRCQ